jgi:chemotaxis family two-component system response regulator Rcp1
MTQRPVEILLAEDSPGDVWLTLEILSQGPVPKNIYVVRNGEEALDYLFRRGAYVNAKRPDLVLLDLNLPRRDGLEVLREVKRDPGLRAITVVMLTTSEAPSDVNAAYDLNVNCYIVKPVDLEEFTVTIRGIEDFWMSMAILPTTLAPTESEEHADSASKGEPEASSNKSGSVSRLTMRRRPEPVRWRVRTACTMRGCRGSGRF